jgi:catechol 2,3-dioxygenase-like lactoylglutathione lyase family enzyme
MAENFNTLGHISLGVQSYEASKAFYDAVLAPLGLKLVYDSMASGSQTPRTLGYGPNPDHELVNLFELRDSAAPGQGCHIAFNAPTRQAVRDFHAAAVRCGGRSNGEPGLRIHYGPKYYAAFVIDPDGWRLEAVCKSDEREPAHAFT